MNWTVEAITRPNHEPGLALVSPEALLLYMSERCQQGFGSNTILQFECLSLILGACLLCVCPRFSAC